LARSTAFTQCRRATIVLEPMANKVTLSKTCLVRFDSEKDQEKVQWTFSPTNRYSVDARAVGRPVESEPLCRHVFETNGERLCRTCGVLAGRKDRRRAPARLWPRQDGLRPVALHPRARAQARRPAQ